MMNLVSLWEFVLPDICRVVPGNVVHLYGNVSGRFHLRPSQR